MCEGEWERSGGDKQGLLVSEGALLAKAMPHALYTAGPLSHKRCIRREVSLCACATASIPHQAEGRGMGTDQIPQEGHKHLSGGDDHVRESCRSECAALGRGC